jgi:hypothetical protein
LLIGPLVIAAALYFAPTVVILLYGLLSIYGGYMLWAASTTASGFLGAGLIYIAIGSIISGVTALLFGGCLHAVLRAINRLEQR